jgi:predicted polyphosphate/ATP-dependent NAD kinase
VRIGLIVNPIAGMGGRVGLKGTDGADVIEEARRRGAKPQAAARAQLALQELAKSGTRFALLTASGIMGAFVADAAQCTAEIVYNAPETPGAADTMALSRRLLEQDVDLILFAGGDGTARDVFDVIGQKVPLLGIPAGVKMHSGVFGTSPIAAGRLAALFAERKTSVDVQQAEILDIDEDAIRANRVAPRLYGYARVPVERRLLQQAKAGAFPDDEAAVTAAAEAIAREMEPDVVYVVGPGRSAKQVTTALGLSGTLLGVDLIRNRKLIGIDVTEEQIMAIAQDHHVRIIAGITGGQGFLFGRGNQQIGPAVIRKALPHGLIVIAGRQKLASLLEGRLLCDTGDPSLDTTLAGHIRVRCGAGEWAMMRIEPAQRSKAAL